MIKHIYWWHHSQEEAEYEDDELSIIVERIIREFWNGDSAFESLTLPDGTVLTKIEQVEKLDQQRTAIDTTAEVLPLEGESK